MPRNLYVREIITILKEPKLCPRCEKEDELEKDIVFENISGGKTFFCSRCEALTIVTNLNLKRVELEGRNEDTIMLKEPHTIRKVSY